MSQCLLQYAPGGHGGHFNPLSILLESLSFPLFLNIQAYRK